MNKINDGGPAFPVHTVYEDCGIDGNSGPIMTETINPGMTLRDYFAAKFMQGFVVQCEQPDTDSIAKWSFKMADAMLAAREAQS